MSSPYALLGVRATASSEEIKNAYREKAMTNHPDRGGDAAVWASMQKAYDTLSNPQKRAAYDSSNVREGSAEKQCSRKAAAEANRMLRQRQKARFRRAM